MESNGSAPRPRRRTAPAADEATAGQAQEAPAVAGASTEEPAPRSGTRSGSRRTAATPGAEARTGAGTADPAAPEILEGARLPEATLASLDLSRGAIGRVDAQDVSVRLGAVGALRAETMHVELGSVGAALTNELHASQASLGSVVAGDVHLQQSVVRTMVARQVVVERPSIVAFLLARRVSGDVRVLFDWRGAAVFGTVVGILSLIGRRRR